MPRKARVLKRPVVQADKKYGSVLVSKLVNRIMWDGKKTIATSIVDKALTKAADELKISPVELLEAVVANVRPTVEVKSVRVGGANYQVPMEPYPARALRLGLTWIVDAARAIKGKPMEEKLATLLVQSYNQEGPAVAKRNTVHQTAAGNKAFAHLASRVKKKTK
jgi:small subunit ribosomal protein S7